MDRSTLRTQLERLHGESFGWALGCCSNDPVVAEEVLQTTYLKVLEGRARFEEKSAFKTWLFAVIRNTAADARRHDQFRRLRLIRYATQPPPDTPPRPDEALYHTERQAQFRALLARLPRRQREVLNLVFYHDQSLREAAVVMGVSLGTARTHYERGKKRIRQWLTASRDEAGSTRPQPQGTLSGVESSR